MIFNHCDIFLLESSPLGKSVRAALASEKRFINRIYSVTHHLKALFLLAFAVVVVVFAWLLLSFL